MELTGGKITTLSNDFQDFKIEYYNLQNEHHRQFGNLETKLNFQNRKFKVLTDINEKLMA
jgi:TolA-binding protein